MVRSHFETGGVTDRVVIRKLWQREKTLKERIMKIFKKVNKWKMKRSSASKEEGGRESQRAQINER